MGAVADAVSAEIERLRVEPVSPGLAALAEILARSVDEADAPTARAVVARELRAVLEGLHRLAPAAEENDPVDQLTQKREERRVRARRA